MDQNKEGRFYRLWCDGLPQQNPDSSSSSSISGISGDVGAGIAGSEISLFTGFLSFCVISGLTGSILPQIQWKNPLKPSQRSTFFLQFFSFALMFPYQVCVRLHVALIVGLPQSCHN